MAGMGVAVGLDFGAALALAEALEVDRGLLAECLPAIEGLLVRRANGSADDDSDFSGFGGDNAEDLSK